MFLNQLVPSNNVLEYIPEYLLDDSINPAVFPALQPYLSHQGLKFGNQFAGFISGAMELRSLPVKKNKDDEVSGSYTQWLRAPEVEEVRVFFRSSQKFEGKYIGSKARVYHPGKDYNSGKEQMQYIDTGFLVNNLPRTAPLTGIFQTALSKTMLYNALYALGSSASIQKLKVPNTEGSGPASYKSMVNIVPGRPSERNEDFLSHIDYEHILDPACKLAGFNGAFDLAVFDEDGNEAVKGDVVADAIVEALVTAKNPDDLKDKLSNLPGGFLLPEEVDDIYEESNSLSANLSMDKNFDNAPGINVVQMLTFIHSLLSE